MFALTEIMICGMIVKYKCKMQYIYIFLVLYLCVGAGKKYYDIKAKYNLTGT